jgi:GH35 family endo-1,4-beta-xylanase
MTIKGHFRRNFPGCAGKAARRPVDHIETVVCRYGGAIPSWDAVNEPRDTTP